MALDKTQPFYGIEQPVPVSCFELLGTTLSMKFATLNVVEARRIFTLEVKQVLLFIYFHEHAYSVCWDWNTLHLTKMKF